MDWHNIDSTSIERIAYEPPSMTLSVQFKHGAIYQYFDVPEAVFHELLRSSSAGNYFAQHIRPAYRFSRL